MSNINILSLIGEIESLNFRCNGGGLNSHTPFLAIKAWALDNDININYDIEYVKERLKIHSDSQRKEVKMYGDGPIPPQE